MKKIVKTGTIILFVFALTMQSVLAPIAYAQEASSSANDIASPSASASSSGTLGTNPATTSGTITPTIPNPFSENGSFFSQNPFSQTFSSLLDASLGNNHPAGSAFVKQKSVIHNLSKRNFKSDESVAVSIGNATADTVAVSVTDDQGKSIDQNLIEKTSIDIQTTVTIHPPSFGFRPGKYSIHIIDSDGTSSTQDFTWGVLAMNTDKSMYLPQETAHMSIAVLDEKGEMVCDANVSLEITDPAGNKTLLSTATKTITVNPQCLSHAFSLVPDYEASYHISQQGHYAMTLSATTKNGTSTIDDSLQVQQSVPFDVTRTSATRLYPINNYPMLFHIKANQDFTGTVKEYAPTNFEISPYATGSAQTYSTASLIVPSIDMQQAFGVASLSLENPFIGNFPMVQGFGVALTDPLEKTYYASFGLAGHDGLDFALPTGTPVAATDDGVVSLAGDGAYGTTIGIDHAWGRSYYGHLNKLEVTVGQHVTKGQEIALSGNSGHTTGPHLHFGIKPIHSTMQNGFYGKADPAPYLNFLNGDKPVLGISTSTIHDVAQKVITWNISVKKGDTIDLAYSYKAPNISPQFYTVGPLTFTNNANQTQFKEARQWQIAVDAIMPATVNPNNVASGVITSTTSWQYQSSSNGNGNGTTIAQYGNVTGYTQLQPGVTNTTNGAAQPSTTSGKGFIYDTALDSTIPGGTWTFSTKYGNTVAGGTNFITVCAWKVTVSGGAIASATNFINCVDSPSNLTSTTHAGATASFTVSSVPAESFNANQYLYIEYWIHSTVASGNTSAQFKIFVGATVTHVTTPGASSNLAPNPPSQDAPVNNAASVSINPVFNMTATDPESDDLQYKVTIYANSGCTTVVQTNDETSSQTGWSGQNVGGTSYTSGTQGIFTTQSALSNSTQYWWKASAIDPLGSNSFTDSTTCNTFTTLAAGPTNDQLMRHGKWFSNGVKQPFTF